MDWQSAAAGNATVRVAHCASKICALQLQRVPLSCSAIVQALQLLQLPLQVGTLPHSHSSTPVEQLTSKLRMCAENNLGAQCRRIFYLISR